MRTALLSFVVIAACGDDGANRLPDAPARDDAPASDALPTDQPVTVLVRHAGQPVANVPVYFQQPDGALASMQVTDTDGEAAAVVAGGGTVTAVNPFQVPGGLPSRELRTWIGVQPGDTLLLADTYFSTPTTRAVTITAPVATDASMYTLYLACLSGSGLTMTGPNGSASAPAISIALDDCLTTDALVEVTHNGGTRSYLYATVTLPDGQTIDLDGTYTPATASTWTWTNIPSGFGSLFFRSYLTSPAGTLVAYTDTRDVVGGGATFTADRATIPASTQVTATTLSALRTDHVVLDWGSSLTFDVGAALLPPFTSGITHTPGSHTLAWTTAATGATPDGLFARLVVFQGAAKSAFTWHVIAPHSPTTLQLPDLPPVLDAFDIAAGDDIDVIDLVAIKTPGGFATLRNRGHAARIFDEVGLAFGLAGRLVMAQYHEPNVARRTPAQRAAAPRSRGAVR